MGKTPEGDWDGVCACGKADADGKRCALGATHQPRQRPSEPEETPSMEDMLA